MSGQIARALAALVAASLLGSSTVAQEPSPNKPAPRLTTDDVLGRRATPAGEVEVAAPRTPTGAPAGWARYSPDGIGLSLDLPGAPRPFEVPMPDAVKNNFGSVKAMICASPSLTVMMMHFTTRSPVTPQSLRDFMGGLLDGIKSSAAARNIKYDVQPITPLSYSIKATTNQNSLVVQQEGIVKGEEKDTWVLLTVYSHSSGSDEQLGKKVLDSVEFP